MTSEVNTCTTSNPLICLMSFVEQMHSSNRCMSCWRLFRYPGAADADECLLEWVGHGNLRRGTISAVILDHVVFTRQIGSAILFLEPIRPIFWRQNMSKMALSIEKIDQIGSRPAFNHVVGLHIEVDAISFTRWSAAMSFLVAWFTLGSPKSDV